LVELLVIVHSDLKRFSVEHLTPVESAHIPTGSSFYTDSERGTDDPWEGCDYIVTEDLFEWFTHYLTQHGSSKRSAYVHFPESVAAVEGDNAPTCMNERFDTPEHMSIASTEVGGDVTRTESSSEMSMSSFGRGFGREAWCKSWQAELRRQLDSIDSNDSSGMDDAAASQEVQTIELFPAPRKATSEEFDGRCSLSDSEESCSCEGRDDWEERFLRSDDLTFEYRGHNSDGKVAQISDDTRARIGTHSAVVSGYIPDECDPSNRNECNSLDWEDEFLRRSRLN
jgi:hypothetical protein